MQQPEPAPERSGYPWWGWLIGIWCLVPVFPMLIGATFPRTRRYLGVPGIILFSLCIVIVIGVATALAGGDDSAVDSPQGTSSAPAVAVPTDTPKPTPTVTIECPTPSERAYFARLVEIIDLAPTAYGEFGRLNLEASDNVLLLFDDTWKLEVVVQLALIQSVADGITELTAPTFPRIDPPAQLANSFGYARWKRPVRQGHRQSRRGPAHSCQSACE